MIKKKKTRKQTREVLTELNLLRNTRSPKPKEILLPIGEVKKDENNGA
jgi:hypothetical protein